jgi:putative transposase
LYSYEDRIQAVRLYIKLGKRTGATIRQLGYLTKNALRAGMGKFERGRDLPTAAVRAWQKYSDEQKQAAVEHYLNHDRGMTGTINALGRPVPGPLPKSRP